MSGTKPRFAVADLDAHGVSGRRVWFGLLAAPAAWIVQGGLGWFFGERICTSMAIPTVRLTAVGVSALAVTTAAIGVAVGWRNWRESGGLYSLQAWDRLTFMSMAGVVVSASFLVGTLWAGLAPIIISSCGGMR